MKYLQYDPRRVRHFYLLPTIFFVAIIALVAYSLGQASKQGSELSATSSSRVRSAIGQTAPDNLLPVDKVKKLASAARTGSSIASIRLESRGGKLVYVVKLVSGTQLAFDAQTGDQLADFIASEAPAEDKSLPSNFAPAIDFVRAREIALTAVPDGTVDRIELIQEGSDAIYRVSFTDGARVDIAADNGTVVRTEAAPKSNESEASAEASDATVQTDDESASQTSDQPNQPSDTPTDSGTDTDSNF